MPDLTDSYCERCGAKYVFNPNAPKTLSLKGARVLARGLKNFVLTDGQSMADAMALARHEDDHEDSTRATEAFHRTFNFCMTCRQYACDNCWNVKVGACLSCAPEPGREAFAPQDHLIVRTPVARWNEDWSLFPEGPAAELVAVSQPPEPFNQPIQLPEPRPVLPPQQPAGQAWPAADILTEAPIPAGGATGKSGHRSSRKPVDPEAASLWPLADEIAPEMTLTPEELELVETRLGADAPQEPIPSSQVAPDARPAPPVPPAAPPSRAKGAGVWAAAAPPIPEQPAAQLPVELSAIDRAPEAQGSPQHLLHLRFDKHPQQSRPHSAPQAAPADHTPRVARLLGRHGAEDAATGAVQQRRRGRRNEPAGDPWPHATTWSERPIEVHDWWGAGEIAAAAPAEPEAASSSPLAAVELPSHEAGTFLTPAPWQVAGGLVPPGGTRDGVDARSAAEVRMSAVSGDLDRPPETTTAPAPSSPIGPKVPTAPTSRRLPSRPNTGEPVHSADAPFLDAPFPESPFPNADWSEADWPDADWLPSDREVGAATEAPTVPEAPHRPTSRPAPTQDKTPDRPRLPQKAAPPPQDAPTESQPTPGRAPASPWPPIGASFPAQTTQGAPWPPPETAPIPAAVVAQGATDQTLSEMWAQSAQEVLNRGSVRVCHRCALPVSTQARFCRRCGTRQS